MPLSSSKPDFERDVAEARRYMAAHVEPEGGWTPAHLMYGAKSPGFEDAEYAREVWKEALR